MQAMTREQFNATEQEPTNFLDLDQRMHLAGLDRNRYAGDSRLHVIFSTGTMVNALQSELQGRLVCDDVEYIEIWIPGDKTNINKRPVQLDDKDRFRTQYDAWRKGIVLQRGTPLTMAPFLTASQAVELGYFHITTVEQLAGVADNLTGNMAGLTMLKQQAQAYLDKAGSAEVFRDQVQKMQAEMDAMRAQMVAMQASPSAVTVQVPEKAERAPRKPRAHASETQDDGAGVLA